MSRFAFSLALTCSILSFSLSTPAGAQTAEPQPAEAYFHGAGQAYIGDAFDEALATVTEGLEAYPSDAKLQALKEKLEEEREQQEQQSQSGEGEQGEQDQEQDQQGEEEPEEPQEEDPSESESDEQETGEAEQNQSGSGEENQQPQPAPQDPTELSREQAERILQALSNEEEELLRQVQKLPARPYTVEKDW